MTTWFWSMAVAMSSTRAEIGSCGGKVNELSRSWPAIRLAR